MDVGRAYPGDGLLELTQSLFKRKFVILAKITFFCLLLLGRLVRHRAVCCALCLHSLHHMSIYKQVNKSFAENGNF